MKIEIKRLFKNAYGGIDIDATTGDGSTYIPIYGAKPENGKTKKELDAQERLHLGIATLIQEDE